MTTKVLVLSLFLGAFSIQIALAQIVYDIHLDNLLTMQQGLGLPHSLQVATGHEALMRLRGEMPSSYTCTVTTPMGVTFNVRTPPHNRFESWSDTCGVRVRDVALADEGRWRLTATAGDVSASGWIEVYVEDDKTSYTAPPISLHDGAPANIDLTSLDNMYCMVAQPASDSSLVSGHCEVSLDRTTRAVKGNWNVFLGLPGQINELHIQRRVSVKAERLDVGYIHDSNVNKIHLYCNILVTEKNITFCRFQRTNSQSGYNIVDGLSDGAHSYYGEGFDQRHCGMTIEEPTASDFTSWRCSVGVQARSGDTIQQLTPLQALISVSSSNRMSRSSPEATETRTVFTQVNKEFTVMCRADLSLRYCWFQHPNGTQYTPLPQTNEDQLFWYTGEDLQVGDCGITFSHATEEDAGLWTCHMGPSDQVGVEVTDRLNVRVTGPLAANVQEVETRIGETATLYCHTSNGVRPLDYCRFMAPNFVGLSLDETVTKENAILNRFHFTPGRELNFGDCSLTISTVQQEDMGVWTCAALVDGETMEARDTVTVSVSGSSHNARRLSQAGIAGMVIGLAGLLAVLGGVVWYKRHSLFLPRSSNRSTDPTVAFSPRALSNASSSGSSNLSMSEVEI